ncbi:MAG: YifB family Mg chelatase-like AAA ATPase [Candidatus Cloacimonetes bacterium]|nr:YifB family Mg chelatase-like AAA ATPase [Candidatus Cloacimonadota bacterium]
MFDKTISYAVNGIDAHQITVEADIKGGLAKFSIVGLPSNTVKESRDRVTAAIRNCGYKFLSYNYTINLAPADLRKDSVALDLPNAVAILAAGKQIRSDKLASHALVGELSLDGQVRPIRGILPIAIAARRDNVKGLLVPTENAIEAAVIEGVAIYPVATLNDAIGFIEGHLDIEPTQVDRESLFSSLNESVVDMLDVKGQFHVKRAIEVAAAGGHNLLMLGPPGSGKTMLARRLSTILPDLVLDEALETTKIHSVSGVLGSGKGIVTERPFRSPHHTISDVALIGGGSYPKPGEVSLAHNGVLFLDELPEFKKSVLEVLRQPLEDGVVTISRAAHSLEFPAEFMLVASMNPCPCGWFGADVPGHSCICPPGKIQSYRARVSGPLLDRIDIHVEVPAVAYADLSGAPDGESSRVVRTRVNAAREVQHTRFADDGIFRNAQMNPRLIRKHCRLDDTGQSLLKTAMDKLGLSARAYDRILKVSRTIADLTAQKDISAEHVSEAVQYRSLDRKFWV